MLHSKESSYMLIHVKKRWRNVILISFFLLPVLIQYFQDCDHKLMKCSRCNRQKKINNFIEN